MNIIDYSSIIKPHGIQQQSFLSYGKLYGSLPDVDWIEMDNVAMIGYLVAFRTPCL